ncbi:MAG: hypothetical protein WA210_19415 [Burkholderiaceae bacterium]
MWLSRWWPGSAAAPLLAWAGATLGQGQVFPDDPQSWRTPQGVASIFQQACLGSAGQAEAAVDWALTQGFEPLDAFSASAHELLEGRPGNVLAAPGSQGRVLLVIAQDQHCSVWAQRISGPQLRLATAEMLARENAGGARILLDVERNIASAGAWRSQTQWRYRAAGASIEFGLSAVTTLSATPATQALNMAPWQAAAAAPDAMTGR